MKYISLVEQILEDFFIYEVLMWRRSSIIALKYLIYSYFCRTSKSSREVLLWVWSPFSLQSPLSNQGKRVYFRRTYFGPPGSSSCTETEKRVHVLLHCSLLRIQITRENILVSSESFCWCTYISFPKINAFKVDCS